jgi:hypothetical protein
VQLQIQRLVIFKASKSKARPDRSSVSEVYIYRNNQDTVAIAAVQPNINDNFLSR